MRDINPQTPLVSLIVNKAAEMLNEHEQLMPVFFVANRDTVKIITALFDSEQAKDYAADSIREIAQEMRAEYILFVSESFAISDADGAQEYIDNPELYQHTIANHPKSSEVVAFMLETPSKAWSGIAEIKPGRIMGCVNWKDSSHFEGRFSNLLGQKPTLN